MHLSLLAKCKKLILSTHFHGSSHSVFRNSLLSLFKPFGRKTLERAEKIIAVSDFEKSLLCEYFKIEPYKIMVIPCGVDIHEFDGLTKRSRDFKSLLYVGRLTSYKGIQYLISVLPKLSAEIHLEIVGEGPFKSQLVNLVERLNLHQRVHFYQKLSRLELLQKFVDADLFVLLSSYEAFSMVVAEALVSGTRCVVSQTSALTEWVDNKYCFGLEPPIKLNSLANLIEKSIRLDNENRDRIFKHKKIKDWNEVVDEIEKIYLD